MNSIYFITIKLNKMIKIFINVFFLIFFTSGYLYSQNTDKIYLKDKSIIEGEIIQVTSKHIEINPVGDKPFLKVEKSRVSILIYSDNTVVDMNNDNSNDQIINIKEADIESEEVFFYEGNKWLDLRDTGEYGSGDLIIDENFYPNEKIVLNISGTGVYRNRYSDYFGPTWYFSLNYLTIYTTIKINGRSYHVSLKDLSDKLNVGRKWYKKQFKGINHGPQDYLYTVNAKELNEEIKMDFFLSIQSSDKILIHWTIYKD